MKKTIILIMTIALLGMIWIGCSNDEQLTGNSDLFSRLAATLSVNNYTETLGDQGMLDAGSGLVVEGTGMVTQPAMIDLNVPGSVVQVLLYWSGGTNSGDHTGDNTIVIEGIEVTGDLIGGPAYFFSDVYFSAYRADITGLGLVVEGANSLTLSGMEFIHTQYEEDNGAALVVVYDDGTTSELSIRDGIDLAFFNFPEPRQTTVPQTFTFAAEDMERTGYLSVVAGSVLENRPNEIKVTIGGVETHFNDILGSTDGADYDAITLPITIPAGATEMTVQAISTVSQDPLGASIAWIVAALDVPVTPPDEEYGECDGKVTELTVKYIGDIDDAHIVVKAKKDEPLFDGIVQPGETFTLYGFDKKGTLGTETYYWVNGEYNTNIHTSCSQPIGPGLIKGDFEVIEGYSRNGGLLPPIN